MSTEIHNTKAILSLNLVGYPTHLTRGLMLKELDI